MLRTIFLTSIACITLASLTEAEPWDLSANANLTLTENAYSDNWKGGESGSLTWTFLLNSMAKKQLSPTIQTHNTMRLAFGRTRTQDPQSRDWSSPSVSTDLINIESMFSFDVNLWAKPFASGRLESQFLDTSDPDKDRYINPLTFTESTGFVKIFWDEEDRDWNTRLGIGLRQHIVRDVLNPVTGSRKSDTSYDGGIELVNDMTTPLAEGRITLTSKLIVFQALTYSESDDLKGTPAEDYWRSPDVNWENIFTAGITEHINVNLYIQFLYDKEIARAGRLKQTLSLGLTYKML